jgi:Cof subfamily protein (haloacid dehalogenase superfamily)
MQLPDSFAARDGQNPAPFRPTSRPHAAPRWRLAAIDLDGTLLSPELEISAENRRAVARLQAAGMEVVLASGRHHASALPFARELPGVTWIVSAQGGEVSDLTRTRILAQTFLRRRQLDDVLDLQAALGLAGVAYTPDGVLTMGKRDEGVDFYCRLSGLEPHRVGIDELRAADIFKVVWIATPETVDRAVRDPRGDALALQRVRTHARLLEWMPHEVTKASGLAVLAAHLEIGAGDAVVFGDAENDLPMFAWAGLSIAMDHGWPLAKRRARQIAPPGPAASAFARAVDLVLPQEA